ncbi:MAG: hypothetical protein JOZ33_16910 [Acidobacteriaceae bacterium]|nr:hypothetical protein [Acidobacteriaceae bacterium]
MHPVDKSLRQRGLDGNVIGLAPGRVASNCCRQAFISIRNTGTGLHWNNQDTHVSTVKFHVF